MAQFQGIFEDAYIRMSDGSEYYNESARAFFKSLDAFSLEHRSVRDLNQPEDEISQLMLDVSDLVAKHIWGF